MELKSPLSQANRNLVRLRSFVSQDLPAMYALDQICFRNGIAYSLAEFEYLTRSSRVFSLIAEAGDNRLAGFAITERTGRGAAATGHIITIDVDPAYRRVGVGRMLMLALEKELVSTGVLRCVLEVAVDDPGAQEFYRRSGYQARGRLRRYYLDSLDAMRLEKTFAEAGTKA